MKLGEDMKECDGDVNKWLNWVEDDFECMILFRVFKHIRKNFDMMCWLNQTWDRIWIVK